MSENNPFTPPESDLQTPRKGGPFIQEFPRLPILLFLGLAMLTFGLYVYAWIYTRNAMMNRCVPVEKQVPSWLSNSVIALGVISFSMSLLAMLSPESALGKALIDVQGIFTFITFGMTLVWGFHFRALLNGLSGATPGTRFWPHGVLLVLFTVYYLQYKINLIHEFGDNQPPSSGKGGDEDAPRESDQSKPDAEKPKQGYIEL